MPTVNYYTVEEEILGQEVAGTRLDYMPDALGSVVTTLDQAKAVLHTARYKPFGADLATAGTHPAFGWVGSAGYREEGFAHSEHYVRARHYAAAVGRWRSVDPLWPGEMAYRYANASPTSWTDPSGLLPCQSKDKKKCGDYPGVLGGCIAAACSIEMAIRMLQGLKDATKDRKLKEVIEKILKGLKDKPQMSPDECCEKAHESARGGKFPPTTLYGLIGYVCKQGLVKIPLPGECSKATSTYEECEQCCQNVYGGQRGALYSACEKICQKK